MFLESIKLFLISTNFKFIFISLRTSEFISVYCFQLVHPKKFETFKMFFKIPKAFLNHDRYYNLIFIIFVLSAAGVQVESETPRGNYPDSPDFPTQHLI